MFQSLLFLLFKNGPKKNLQKTYWRHQIAYRQQKMEVAAPGLGRVCDAMSLFSRVKTRAGYKKRGNKTSRNTLLRQTTTKKTKMITISLQTKILHVVPRNHDPSVLSKKNMITKIETENSHNILYTAYISVYLRWRWGGGTPKKTFNQSSMKKKRIWTFLDF